MSLDVIHDSIQRFESSHTILLCGDLNGTLLQTRNNKHDIMLKDFMKDHCLSIGSHSSVDPTFFDFNGTVSSQIDYILCSDPKLLKVYTIFERQAENVSPYGSFRAELSVQSTGITTRKSSCKAEYYEDLVIPKDHDYDNIFPNLCNLRCNEAQDKSLNSAVSLTFCEDDVDKAIDQLNTGKSTDEYGLLSEHFKAEKSEIVPVITIIFNKILKIRKFHLCLRLA